MPLPACKAARCQAGPRIGSADNRASKPAFLESRKAMLLLDRRVPLAIVEQLGDVLKDADSSSEIFFVSFRFFSCNITVLVYTQAVNGRDQCL